MMTLSIWNKTNPVFLHEVARAI